MAAGDTVITLVGNLVDDPELRFTPSGAAVAKFRIASTPRFLDKQTNEWKDGESLFLSCNVWRQAAENVAESLQRGMRVIVQGRLKQRSYETKEGEKRTVYEIEVDEVGPSLKSPPRRSTRPPAVPEAAASGAAAPTTTRGPRPLLLRPATRPAAAAAVGAGTPPVPPPTSPPSDRPAHRPSVPLESAPGSTRDGTTDHLSHLS